MADLFLYNYGHGMDSVITDCPLLMCESPNLKDQQKVKEKLELGWRNKD